MVFFYSMLILGNDEIKMLMIDSTKQINNGYGTKP